MADEWQTRERERIISMFDENVELDDGYCTSHYWTFSIVSVDGVPCSHRIKTYFYYDQSYIPFDSRDPEGYVFRIVDEDVNVPTNGSATYKAVYACRFSDDTFDEPVVSIEEALLFAYTHYTNVGNGRVWFDSPIGDEEAYVMMEEALGRRYEVTDEDIGELRKYVKEQMRKLVSSEYDEAILFSQDANSGECLIDEVVDDVYENSAFTQNGTYTESDVQYAFGGILARRLGV